MSNDLPQIKVTKDQFYFYWNLFHYSSGSVPKTLAAARMSEEFNLSKKESASLYDEMEDGFFDFFDIQQDFPFSQTTYVPSHENDRREPFYVPEEFLKSVHLRFEDALDGEAYKNFRKIDTSIRENVLEKVDIFHDIDPYLSDSIDQYPFGVYPRKEVFESLDEAKNSIQGVHGLTRYLQNMEGRSSLQKGMIYFIGGKILLEEAKDLLS